VQLFLKADVWCPVTLSASVLSFAPVLKGTKVVEPRNLDVNVTDPEPLNIAGATCDNPFYKVELKTVEEGRRYQVTVTPTGPAETQQNAEIALALGHPRMKELKVPIYFIPAEAVVVQPMQVNISKSDLQLKSTAFVVVSSNDPSVTRLEVTGMTYSGGGDVSMVFERFGEGKLGRVILTFPAGYTPPRANDAFFTFHTNHPAFPDFKIPVRFTAPRPDVLSGGVPH